jgi:hypothetical protein
MILAIGFAPVVMDVCQGTCAVHAMSAAASSQGDGHSSPYAHASMPPAPNHQHPAACHESVESSRPVAGQALRGVPHTCSHLDDLPASAAACPQQTLSPPMVVATTLDLSVPDDVALPWADHVPSPIPLRVAATTQLRV